jgi:hypothetical protein
MYLSGRSETSCAWLRWLDLALGELRESGRTPPFRERPWRRGDLTSRPAPPRKAGRD